MDIFEARAYLVNLLDALSLCGVLSDEELEDSDTAMQVIDQFVEDNIKEN